MFDGHLERPLLELTVAERLDWIWEGMQLLWLGRQARRTQLPPDDDKGAPEPPTPYRG